MPISDPHDRFFYPYHTPMIDTYYPLQAHFIVNKQARKQVHLPPLYIMPTLFCIKFSANDCSMTMLKYILQSLKLKK